MLVVSSIMCFKIHRKTLKNLKNSNARNNFQFLTDAVNYHKILKLTEETNILLKIIVHVNEE